MSEDGPSGNPVRTALLIAGGLAVLGGVVWLGLSPGERAPNARAQPRSQAGEPSSPVTPRGVDRPAAGEIASVPSGGTVKVSKDELPEGGELVLDLLLGEASKSAEPLEGRIISPESQEMPLAAIVSEDRMSTRVAVPADWLSSGRYIIEVKTTEQSHFPIRRYALEVR